MPRSRKINLEKVRASLDKVCPKCGKLIPPVEVRRIDFERIECPVCGERFAPVPRANRGFEIAVGIPLTRYPPRGPGRALVSASGSYRG
jgi:ribosomal protein S27AE